MAATIFGIALEGYSTRSGDALARADVGDYGYFGGTERLDGHPHPVRCSKLKCCSCMMLSAKNKAQV
jgi:hypothetical protein